MCENKKLSLYDDWLARRSALENSSHDGSDQLQEAHIRVFDYLIQRYAGTNIANTPARFPQASEVFFDRRAMWVFHQVDEEGTVGIKTQEEAQDRARTILGRISKKNVQESVKSPAFGIDVSGALENMIVRPIVETSKDLAAKYGRTKERESNQDAVRKKFARMHVNAQQKALEILYLTLKSDIELAKSSQSSKAYGLKKWILEHEAPKGVKACFNVDARPIDILMGLQQRGALDYTHLAWRERVAEEGVDLVLVDWERLFFEPFYRKNAAHKMRMELANSNASVRLRAIHILKELGSLDDVGLLSDLAQLPAQAGDAPNERELLLEAAELLARKGYGAENQ